MTTRRTILMLTTQLGFGGAETSFIRLANFLAQSMDVTVVTFGGAYSVAHEPLSAPIVLLDKKDKNLLTRWVQRIRAVRALKKRHDVTISFLSGPNLVNVLAGYNTRSVVSLRGSRFYDPVASVHKKLLFQYVVDPIVFFLAARIVPVSHGIIHEVRRVAGRRSLEKICVIPPFIDMDSVRQRLAEPAPDNLAALKGQNVVIGVGRLSIEKGFDHLIRVFAHVAKTHTGAKLLLVGDGPMKEALRQQCNVLGLGVDELHPDVSSVIFAGYHTNVLSLMKLGRVYAMTSATEGFPNVLLEAMAVGLPILAANTPWGVRSILCHDAASSAAPYPTEHATRVAYGTLMPRIDLPRYQPIWVEALCTALDAPESAAYEHRARDFDLARIGKSWLELIESL